MSKSFLKAISLSALAAAMTGCAAVSNGAEQALSIEEEHPISVDSQTVTMTIDLADTAGDLTAVDKARLRAFAGAYMNDGHGLLTVTAPAGGGADRAGQDAQARVRKALHEFGVSDAAMTGSAYEVGQAGDRQIVLSYTRYVATPSACGIWNGEFDRNYRNLRSANFGCSAQNNLAAMIGDPRDLVEPSAMTDPDTASRVSAVDKYRKGEVTSSESDQALETKVSKQ
jgi:pilus assembly protein CpaD